MAQTKKDVVAAFSVTGADASKQDIDKIRGAAEEFGDAGKTAAQGLVNAFQNIENADEKLTNKISQGRAVTVKDGAVILQQFEVLKEKLASTFGSIEKAPAEIQAAFSKAEAQVSATTKKVASLTDAVDDNKQALKEGGGAYTGLADTMNKALGPAGALQVQLIGIGAAFKEGWSMGMMLNKLFGTDMSEWEAATAQFGAKANAVLKALSDVIIGSLSVIGDVLTGHFADAKQGLGILKGDLKTLDTAIGDSVTKWGDDWDKAHPPIKKTTDALAANTAAAIENAKALAAHGKVIDTRTLSEKMLADAVAITTARLKAIQDAQEKYGKAIADTTAAQKAQSEELTKQDAALALATGIVAERTHDMQAFTHEVNDAAAALAAQTTEVEALTAKYGANDPMTKSAIERQGQLEHSLEVSKGRYDQAKKDVDDYSKKQDDASKAIEAAKNKIGELTTKLGEQQADLTKAITSTGSLGDNLAKTAQHGETAATGITKLGTAAAGAAEPTRQVASAIEKLPEPVHKTAEELKPYNEQLEAVVKNTNALLTANGLLATSFNTLRTSANLAKDAILGLNDAMAKAAGGEDGGGPPEPKPS